MKIRYDGSFKCWLAGNAGLWQSGSTPQEAVANWIRGMQ